MKTLRHGWRELRAHPGRNALNALSLLVGVLAVVGIVATGTVLGQIAVGGAEQSSGRRATYSAEVTTIAVDPESLQSALSALEPLTATGGGGALLLGNAAPVGLATGARITSGQPFEAAIVTFVAGDLSSVRRLPVIDGVALSGDRILPPQFMVNQAAEEKWGPPGTRMALVIGPRARPTIGTIVGVIADGQPTPMVYASGLAFVKFQTALSEASVTLLLHHPFASQQTIYEVATDVARTAGWRLDEQSFQRVDQVDQLLASLRVQQIAFAIAALIGLVTAAIGILNIGLASIQERARELVIRRALGATRAQIIGQMLVAAVLIALLASVLAAAVVIGLIVAWVPDQIPQGSALDPPGVPWSALAVGTLAACVTTLLGSAVPAVAAARLDIATALRD